MIKLFQNAIVLLAFISITSATTLTYKMAAKEKGCFYAAAKLNEKIAFYFAVQSGGNFDVDYEVLDPVGKVVMQGSKERQVDYVFSAQVAGDFSFCFFNQVSDAAEKIIDFDITVEQELSEWEESQKDGKAEKISALEHGVDSLNNLLSGIQKYQKYFRARENRNMYTVQSTESYIFWLALFSSLLMVLVPLLQVLIVKTFFSSKQHYSSNMTSVNSLRAGPHPLNTRPAPAPAFGFGAPSSQYTNNPKARFL